MATFVNLTINARDIVGENFDPRHAAAFIVTNTEKGIVVVDGVEVQAGGRRQKFDLSGQVVFSNLVATNSASNPATFAYRVQLVWTSVGSREKENWTSSDFPLTTSKNLAAIPEAFDGLAISPTWQSDFRDEMEAIAGLTGEDAAIANRITTGGSLTDVALKAAYVGKGSLVLDVADYGAIGNGTNDDTTAIQTALTAARAAKARLRFGFNKTYIVSSALNPAGVHVEGFGATLKTKPGTTQTYGVLESSGPFTAENLTIDLNKANTTDPAATAQGMGIYAFAASGWTTGVVTLRNVRVVNGHQMALRIGSTFAGTNAASVSNTPALLENVSIDNCKFGIWLQNVAGVKVITPEITNTGAGAGIYDYMSRDTQVIGGRIDTTGGHGYVSQYSLGALVSGLRVNAAGDMGIVFGGGIDANAVCQNFTVQGCVVRNSVNNGYSVDPTKVSSPTTPQNTWGTITGNIADSNGMHGFYLHNAKYSTVTGNIAKNHAGVSAGGLALDSLGCAISGNVLVGNTFGLKFQGAVAGYGSHDVGRNTVTGNGTNYSFDVTGADNTTLDLQGTAFPNTAIAAPVGSTYRRLGGGAATTLYVKESGGVTSSGWVGK